MNGIYNRVEAKEVRIECTTPTGVHQREGERGKDSAIASALGWAQGHSASINLFLF